MYIALVTFYKYTLFLAFSAKTALNRSCVSSFICGSSFTNYYDRNKWPELDEWQKVNSCTVTTRQMIEHIRRSRLLVLGPLRDYTLELGMHGKQSKTSQSVRSWGTCFLSHLASACRLSVCCPSRMGPEASRSSRWTPCSAGRWSGRRRWPPPAAHRPTRRAATTTSCPPAAATPGRNV